MRSNRTWGISIDVLGLLGMYFDAAVVFVKKTSLLFRLDLAILWPGFSSLIQKYWLNISLSHTLT